MVVAQRLAFVRRCIIEGEQVWLSVSPSAANARAKLKVRICPGKANTSMIARKMLLAVLDGVALVAQDDMSVHSLLYGFQVLVWLAVNKANILLTLKKRLSA